MRKIWINSTTSNSWNGEPVGIVRVERNLVSLLAFDQFVKSEYGFEKFEKKLNQNPHVSPSSGPLKRSEIQNKVSYFLLSARLLNRKIRILRSLGYAYSTLFGFSKKLDALLSKFSFHLYSSLQWFNGQRLSLRQVRREQIQSRFLQEVREKPKRHPFSNGDLVFTCGLDWDHTILEELSDIKDEIDIKIATVVYDLIPLTNPEFIQNARHVSKLLGHFSYLVKISDLVFVNSNHTKNSLIKFAVELGLPVPKIEIIPWGDNSGQKDTSLDLHNPFDDIKENDFFLAVGTFEIRKNYGLLMQLAKLNYVKQLGLPKIVIVGRPGWGTHDLISELEHQESLQKQIRWVKDVSDESLNWLYRNCKALLSPSFDEGFGLPVVESQNYQKKLILSDIPIYRELFPNAQFASPFNPAEWIEKMKDIEVVSIPTFKTYSWEESATRIKSALLREFDQ